MTVEPMTDTEFAAFCARAYRCDARIGTIVLRRDEAERLLARFEAICDGAIAERARIAAARQEGYREGAEAAAQWHDERAAEHSRYATREASGQWTNGPALSEDAHRRYAEAIRALGDNHG